MSYLKKMPLEATLSRKSATEQRLTDGLRRQPQEKSLTGICLRHSMTNRRIYTKQEEVGGSRHAEATRVTDLVRLSVLRPTRTPQLLHPAMSLLFNQSV
ncbi:hypothetical protein [Ottowia testudinis]|uniref:Uncharacterized protein n=1 Tax=Ottowia testudinis TaxID=2816950 RepID=A0A975CG69_9BURK|nr:hypothetical protein [Ottowia testudinis]QTD43574.1 hypothetical protein J1M35_10270 [Ottowia testudinis]